MITTLKTVLILFLIMQISGCVVLYTPTRTANIPQQTGGITPLEMALIRFPVVPFQNESFNTLYITVVNYKKQWMAEIELLDTLRTSYYGDSLSFRITIRNFEKNLKLNSTLSFPIRLFEQLNFTKLTPTSFRISSSNLFDSSRSSLLTTTSVESDRSELLYIHTGQLVNAGGSEVSFWAQTDVVATKILYGAVITSSNFLDNVSSIIDVCRYKVEEERKKLQCSNPKLTLDFYCSPLAQIFSVPVKENFYKDCVIKKASCK